MKPVAAVAFFVALLPISASAHFSDFKSPGPGMHFTVGQPIVVFGDLFDANNIHGVIVCPAGQTLLDNNGVAGPAHCSGNGAPVGWPKFQVFADNVLQVDGVTHTSTVVGTTDLDSNMNPDPINFNRFVITGLPVGTHTLKLRGLFAPPPDSDGATLDSPTMSIVVDPVPAGKTTLTLNANVTGSVNWNNLIVVGNGHSVNANGAVTITNSLVTGLGSMTSNGIEGTATALDIENSVFESTGAVELTLTNGATVKNNEFRANNLLTFEASDPEAAPILTLSGKTAPTKLFQGNRVGAGRVVFYNTSHWLVGGDTDAVSNILIGPRATIYLASGTSNVTVRGNYDHHNYRGGWSQGFNLVFSQASSVGILVEHNLFRGSSWPIEGVTGEFRYNLIYGYGHTWLRGGENGALIHHNVFAPEEGGGEVDQGIWFYSGETGIQIYNNTFDGGGNSVSNHGAGGEFPFSGPIVQVNNASQVASLRNNLMTYTTNFENSAGSPHVVGDTGTFGSVDYNAFYSPDNTTHDNYAIAGKTEGITVGFATHDVSGNGAFGVKDAQLAAMPYAGLRVYPYESVVNEASVWNKTQTVSGILAAFRARYMPASGSPVIDAGDPLDNDTQGRRADIGAIDRSGHDQDKFGLLSDVIFDNGFE